jgi:hypothetical protein
MFWSLDIEICDLFVIWCLRFVILSVYNTFVCHFYMTLANFNLTIPAWSFLL